MRIIINILVLTLGILLGALKVSAAETTTEPVQVEASMTLQDYKEYYDYTKDIETKSKQTNLKVAIIFVLIALIVLVALRHMGVIST